MQHEFSLVVGQDTFTLPLLKMGIYYAQLENAYTSRYEGWYCNIQHPDNLLLPEEVSGDWLDYWENLLENQSLENFYKIIKRLNLFCDRQQLERTVPSLQGMTNSLPEWLEKSLLIQKVEALIKPYTTVPPTEVLPPQLVPTLTYQIELQRNGRETRKAFCNKLFSELRRTGLEQLILERKERACS